MKHKYQFTCQICGKPFTTSYPQTKACKIHRKAYTLQHNNDNRRKVVAMAKAYKEYLAH